MMTRLEASFKQLSRFSSDIAHELRSPINNLISAASVTQSKDRSPQEYRETLAAIIEEGERLSRMISSMLFLARADNSREPLHREPLNSVTEFERLMGYYDILAEEKNIRLTCEGDVSFQADALHLQRALSNLLSNLITDNLTDAWNVPLVISSLIFSLLLLAVFILWYRREGTLSIHHIDSRRRELFYWLAILATFALGTAVGDWLAENVNLGYYGAAVFFGTWIVIIAGAHFIFKANPVFCFWAAYILTRPFGAACGDLLSQQVDDGGIGLGANLTSLIFGFAIVLMIAGLVVSDRRKRAA
ncbi:histidine kinase dimerization/phospho-acceptor domain-containing protein [Pantoea sp. A4]|uniref:histidine kinase dimerization/phospho-acceptor domain-containing protein n=1 Tax=Pantoea sp. A4 TaxID=1225184 RepID=UPI00307C292A